MLNERWHYIGSTFVAVVCFIDTKMTSLDSWSENTSSLEKPLADSGRSTKSRSNGTPVIYSKFSLNLTGFFSGKHFIQFLANKMQDLQNFVLHNYILIFYAEQVYLKLQVTNQC